MSKYIPGNQKHLTLDDRIYIQNELSKGTSFKDIARFLCKDPTTISLSLIHIYCVVLPISIPTTKVDSFT